MRASPPFVVAFFFVILAGIAWAVTTTPTHADLEQYFPPRVLKASMTCTGDEGRRYSAGVIGDAYVDRFASIWRAADEPSFYLQSRKPNVSGLRAYRFTLVQSFDDTVVVRLNERAPGDFWITAKMLSGDSRPVSRRVERRLATGEAQSILGLIAKTGAMALEPASCRRGAHGWWIFEGTEPAKLQYAGRYSPEADPMRELGLGFLELTGWSFDRLY